MHLLLLSNFGDIFVITESKSYFDIYFMEQALVEADLAEKNGDVPVGALIVKNRKILARAHNMREVLGDVTAHAEIIAIRKAAQETGSWLLEDCELYVTLEPCIMCFGAIVQARIAQVYFGAFDPKTGACGSLKELAGLSNSSINHHTKFQGGILKEKCSNKLKHFFQKKRNSAKLKNNIVTGGKENEQ